MKKIPIIILFLISLLFPAFTSAQTTVIDSFLQDGIYRSYRIYIPALYDGSKSVPVVLNMHGLGSNAFEQENYGDFRAIADTANFIIIHPNGSEVFPTYKGWNTFGAIGSGVDDLKFLSVLLDTIEKKYKVDKNRVYATGMSNGGFMSYELACFMSNRITAIASVTGSMTEERRINCKASHATPIMEIHGTADKTVGYDGTNYLSGIPAFTDIDSLMKYWTKFNYCSSTPIKTILPNISTTDGCTAEHYVWKGGKEGSTVEHYKIIGGAHTWPGSPFITGVTNQDFNASKEIWRFFSQYKLNDFSVSIKSINTEKFGVKVYPNPAKNEINILIEDNFSKFYKFQIHDAYGRLIFMNETKEKLIHFSTNNLSPGVYFLQISDDQTSIITKVIFN